MDDDEVVVLGLAQPRPPRRAGLRRRRAESLVAQDPRVCGCSPDPSCRQRNRPGVEEQTRQVRREAGPPW